MGGQVYGRILAVYGRILGVYGRIPWVYGRIHKVYGRIPRPWHWVGETVPFVNRPFESEIHGTVNFTYFCCVLLVTWCYRVLLSCYLRPK